MEMKKIKLGELFNEKQIKQIGNFLENDEWVELRKFLNSKSIKNKLLVKEINSDYIYYWFEHSFKGGK